MPYATNPLDGVRTYFEDLGGDNPAVLFYRYPRRSWCRPGKRSHGCLTPTA
jgi:hypothetical protein